ncbi:MAG TPA: VCBS repeat-containing protein [Vicinamibacteria bacterium]|nr:VCBS repeat-containing protein [Vicinamibacteria bacterium]
MRRLGGALAVFAAACGGNASGPSDVSPLAVELVQPPPRTVSAARDGALVLRFDRPLRRDSLLPDRTLHVFGRWSGTARGRVELSDGDRVATFLPARPFSAGEQVMVLLGGGVAAADGTVLRPAGYSAQFWVSTRAGAPDLAEAQRLNTRPAGLPLAQAYGGVASDLDADGHLDLAIVNETAGDLSVFLNRGNGTFAEVGARAPLGRRASPSEAADFDRDGRVDIAVANINDGTVSILLGRGDGTFAAQVVAVGATPRGLAVLDVDGDADADVATANYGADDLAVLVNDGRGRFAVGFRAESGARGEWGLGAADLDEDGILDLAVGAQDGQRIIAMRNHGDGRFSPLGGQAAGGGVWMLATGDVDGDRHEDVAAVNGRSNNGAVLRGDGRGGFAVPQVFALDPFVLASDLGDLDGDGDLDWVTSSFSGDWRLFENVGGAFRVGREIAPRQAASCALMFDADGDGDLDLALIDELSDDVIVLHNRGATP